MEDAEERLKALLTPDFERRIKDLMTRSKSRTAERNVSYGVAEALALLYAAFSRYSMSEPFDFCSHCVSAEEVDELRRTPLHDLTFDQLSTIAYNIIFTIGAVADFKFFLPRLIEAARYGAPYYIETVFTRFRDTEFDSWPTAERLAVGNYVRQQFEENVSSPIEQSSGPTNMDALICCAYYAGMLPEILARWISDPRATAQSQLLEWILSEFGLPDDPTAYLRETHAPVQATNAYYDALGRETLLAWLKTSGAQRAVSDACTLRGLSSERRWRLERILGALDAT
ncbi:MAG: hypothetical protein JO324_03400 [Candidatus Eremiobacteraeota bacterium]|nr:hypothetical protein [Candidatus Eremiobacteraeota bacterium]